MKILLKRHGKWLSSLSVWTSKQCIYLLTFFEIAWTENLSSVTQLYVHSPLLLLICQWNPTILLNNLIVVILLWYILFHCNQQNVIIMQSYCLKLILPCYFTGWIYVIEMILKVYSYGFENYWRDGQNRFDFVITVTIGN
jgi:hypothetical protein